MSIAHSKLTSQGQISIPAEVRKRLGVGPGSVLEWHDRDGEVVVRKAGRFSSSDIHQAVFDAGTTQSGPTPDAKTGIRNYIRRRHARR